MAKQLNVSLAFTADTGKARAQLQDLQKSLEKLISATSTNTSNFGLTKELAAATTEASKLKIMLESATSASGGLDLGKFNQGLKKSGMELKDYAEILSSLGPEGSKTFAKLAQSITTANVPLKQTNKLLDEFATTMKNTVRWQFSSSMLHGFMGAVSGALGYAKDLDKSLNDIRIVTGYNTDQMAKFAEQANRAAKALSSTTTDYTNASLIYYQQGLNESEIEERTEVTLKMANAAGVSAQTVSDQMTAVWNNFDDGSKSLEYYADVMTALGAATASSTDEISAGLNKFAAVAETVGLSYEYATAALATVTSTTRESADVVGTAFKTLFARIQGLNLGETLDDGTTLNKYSQALEKVGISIFQSNGEMKEMNDILDEMGAKWGTMSKDQQTALAQTVAGVRQYTQLVALMDNWDFFKENVKTAETATGALQEQADIYAESWEASSKRVKAAAEGIYDKLIDEDFFIGVNDVLEGTLTQVGNLIDGLGGLPGVLTVVSNLMLKAFGKDISEAISQIAYNIKLTSKSGQEEILNIRKSANSELRNMYSDSSNPDDAAKADMVERQANLQDQLIDKTFELEKIGKSLTENEQKRAEALLDQTNELSKQYEQVVKLKNETEVLSKNNSKDIFNMTKNLNPELTLMEKDEDGSRKKTDIKGKIQELKSLQTQYSTGAQILSKYEVAAEKAFKSGDTKKQAKLFEELKKHLSEVAKNAEATGADFDRLASIFEVAQREGKDLATFIKELDKGLETLGSNSYDEFEGFRQALQDAGADMEKLNPKLNAIWESFTKTGKLTEEQIQTFANYGIQITEAGEIIEGFKGTVYTTGDSIVALAEGISAITAGINALKGLGDIWSDEDLTYGEKILSTITTLASVIPILVSSYQSWSAVKLSGIKNDIIQAALNQKLIVQQGQKYILAQKGKFLKVEENALTTKQIALELIKQNLDIKKLAVTLAIVAAIGALVAIGKALYDSYNKEAIAAKKLAEAQEELNKTSQEARAEADKLNSAISGYDEAVEKLNECTKGTEEWRDALKEVNAAAIEVIENLPDALPDNMKLTDLYSKDSNGMIVFDEDKLNQVQSSVDLDAESAAYAASVGDVRAQQAQITSDSVDLFREMVKTQNNMAMAAASSGTTSPVNYIDGRSLVDNLEELSNLPFDEFKSKLESLGVETAYLTDTALADYQDQINQLAESSEFAAEKLDLITRVKVDDVLGDDYDSETKDIAARGLSAEEERLRNEYYKRYTGSGINKVSGANNEIYQEILADLQAAGYDYDAQKSNAVRGTDDNRSFAFLDENGEEVVRTAEWVAEVVAASKALEGLEASAEEASTWLNNLDDNASDSTASGIRSVISGGDLKNLTQEEINQLVNEMGGSDGLTNDEIISYLKSTMGVDDAQLAQIFDVDSVDQVATKWLDIIDGTNERFAQIAEDLPASVKNIFEGMDLDKLSLAEQGIVGKLLTEAFENGGTEGAAELESILSSMFTASGKDADELAKVLGGVNWQTTNVNELSNILEDAGINTEGFSDELANLIDLMKEGQNVGFDAAAEHYSNMKGFMDLEKGDTITEEEKQLLDAAGVNTSQFFKLMGDGTYELINDAEEFYRIVNEKSLDVFKSNIESLYGDLANIDSFTSRRTEDTIAGENLGENGYNQTLVADQLAFLDALNVDFEGLEKYQRMVAEGQNMSVDTLQQIQDLVEENKHRWDEFPASIQATAAEIEKQQIALANSATTVDELNRLYEQQYITLEQYNNAVEGVMEQEFEMEGLDPDAANDVADAFRDMADAGVEGMEALKEDEEAVKDATVRYMKLNEAIEDIYDNYDDYTDVLKDVRKATNQADRAMAANSENAKKLKVSMASLLGTTEDMIDADFLATIDPKDFEAAANGNADAIERIRNQFIQLKAEMYGVDFDSLSAELDAFNDGAYIDLDTTPFLNSLIQAAVNAGATAAEIESMLSGFGIDADVTPFTEELWNATQQASAAGESIANATSFTTEVEQTPVDNTRTVENPQFDEQVTVNHRYGWNTVTMNGSFLPISYPSIYAEAHKGVSTSTDTQEFTDTEIVAGQTVTNGEGKSGKGGVIVKNAHKATAPSRTPSAANTSRPPVSSSSGGGGSSKEKEPSKPKKIDTTNQEEIVKRYKEIDDTLDDLSDEYEKASRSADRLWGEHRLDAIREQNKLIEEQQEALAKKQEQAEQYMKQDRAALQQAAAEAGLSFSFDDQGNITNYTDQMTALYQQLANAEAHYNSLATGEEQDAYEETILEPLRDKISSIEDAMALYEESKELFEELGLEIDDLKDQIMQNNYDIIMEGLELHVSFNEEDLEVIDYYLSKLEDDFYSMAEAAVLMASPDGNSQLTEYIDNLHNYEATLNNLNQAYANGEITEAMYEEGLEEVRAGIRDNLSSLVELDKTMMEYYGETLTMAQDELAKYTDQMEHQTEVLEHYQSLMETLGKETDYNALGIILEGQAKTIENQVKVAKEAYAMYQAQADEKKRLLDEAIAAGNTEAAAVYEKEWEAANQAAMEAQQDMLDKTEAWAESLRAILENKLSGFAQDLENALTGGTSFDTLTTSMERAASLQEEYLTTTNQIYETNKLMRTAQQAIDASTSSIAKNKLKQFINETKQLQDQNKLSEYELEIQQAKYNLLLAEMALEDARDAKTVVRLKRDNEGNLGYVYTADQDKLAEAQQELEDAQNSLYNIGLEGANEYSEKYQQTMSEMYDTFTELQEQYLSGEFETEAEYQDAMLKAKEYYYEKLKNYSSLHQVALTTDARVVADAWSSEYSDMIFNTEDWMRHVTDYVHNVNDAFTEWNNNVDMIANETLGPDLDSLESNVKDITDANDALTDSIVKDGGVIDAIEEELDQVSNLTGKYATLRQQIQGLIADHEQMMVRMGNEPNPYTPPGTGTAGSGSSGGSSSSGSSGSSSSSSSSSGDSGSSSGAYGSSGSGSDDVNAPDYSELTKQGVALAIWNGGFGWGNGTTRRNRLDEKGFDPEEIQRIIDVTNPNGDWRTRYGISDLSKYAYSSFDTGGYTGAWGSYGKFAMLHEKELILNPGETENFLASMEVLRSIIKMIDLQSTASQLGGLLHSPGYYAPQSSEVLEQNVHIEASFPEATDRYEIEAALTSIVNRASQYANRK